MAGLIDLNGLGHFKAKENAMVADTYSASKTYAVGDYVYYNGTLYRCTTAISTTEAWTAGHWTAVKLADDCSSLKTAITLKTNKGTKTIVNSIAGYDENQGVVEYDDSWWAYNNPNYKHIVVPITGTRNILKIKAGTHATRYEGLTEYAAPKTSSHEMHLGSYWVRRIDVDAGKTLEAEVPPDVKYIAINSLYNTENCIAEFELTSYDYEETIQTEETTQELHRITVATQNVRDFSDGTGDGCPDALVSTNLPLWKNHISKWLNADFLALQEWFPYFDRSHTIDSYNTLLKQFFPYKWELPFTNPVKIILSKHNGILTDLCNFADVKYSTPMIICNIAGKKVAAVCWVQSSSDTVERRTASYNNAIAYLAQFDVVIVAGDFNTETGLEELSPWTTAGYTLGNGGYWGTINTWSATNPTTPNDNIVTKGVNFDNIEIGDAVTSDHKPLRAFLSFEA